MHTKYERSTVKMSLTVRVWNEACPRQCTAMHTKYERSTVKMTLAVFAMKLVHGSQYTVMHMIFDRHYGYGLG